MGEWSHWCEMRKKKASPVQDRRTLMAEKERDMLERRFEKAVVARQKAITAYTDAEFGLRAANKAYDDAVAALRASSPQEGNEG